MLTKSDPDFRRRCEDESAGNLTLEGEIISAVAKLASSGWLFCRNIDWTDNDALPRRIIKKIM